MAEGVVSTPRGQDGFLVLGPGERSSPVEDVAIDLDVLYPFTLVGRTIPAKARKAILADLLKMQRYREEQEHKVDPHQKRLLDFDPKQGGKYYTRFYHGNLSRFDLDEESPHGPMRFTDAVFKDKSSYELCEGINIYSVKISCSDVGFPIHVYGTVIARDSIDKKCVYLFRRDRDHCQTINSKDESLVLTGPKRGLVLISNNYVEINLKIRDDHQGQGKDRELSKGFLTIRGIARRSLMKCVVETESLATRLSTVEVMYGFMARAVEGTISIEVKRGRFDGQITAHTSSIQDRIVLYDRELYGMETADGDGVLQLVRPVVCVSVRDKLVIVAKTRDGRFERTIPITPRVNGADEEVIPVGVAEMCVKVTWSIMDLRV